MQQQQLGLYGSLEALNIAYTTAPGRQLVLNVQNQLEHRVVRGVFWQNTPALSPGYEAWESC